MKKPKMFFRTGNKVALRPILKEDINQFVVWMNDPELTQYLARYAPMSIHEEERWYEQVTKSDDKKYTLAIIDLTKNIVIGVIGIHDIDYRSGTAFTGSAIGNKKYWGKGYGTEAKMLLLDFAFHELNLRKIYSHVIGFNKRSVAYSKKCGYVQEAILPNHYYKRGAYHDQIILALYRNTWEELWKKFQK